MIMTNHENNALLPSQLEEATKQLQLQGCKRIELKYRTAKVTMRVTWKGISIGAKGYTQSDCLVNLQERLRLTQWFYGREYSIE